MITYLRFLTLFTLIAACMPDKKSSQVAKSSLEAESNMVTISGKVNYPQDEGYIILQKMHVRTLENIDTISLSDDSTFQIGVEVEHPNFYRIDFYQKQIADFILNDEDIKVEVDGNNREGFIYISGSTDTELFKKLAIKSREFVSKVQSINQEFVEARIDKREEEAKQIQERYFAISEDYIEKFKNLIDSMGHSVAAIYGLEYLKESNLLNYDEEFSYLKSIAGKFQDQRENPVVNRFITNVNDVEALTIGKVAPEITLPDPEGEMVSLSSLRGNYVLIDFWAAWCKPCRVENPNVVRLYKKYNDQGFEIFGVSLDRNREAWLEAIEKDGLIWYHVSDLKFWQSEVTDIYNIKGIPLTYLIDPEGKIIAKNLRGKNLEDKLEEIFG